MDPDNSLNDAKIYELIVQHKDSTENKLDEVNKYYISLFTAMVSITPFIDQISDKGADMFKTAMKMGGVTLLIIGIILSISWILSIRRMHHYIKGIDKSLIEIEKRQSKFFFTNLKDYLTRVQSPGRITHHEIIIPCAFLLLFAFSLIYSLKIIISS